jgi:hypothetical protein
MQLKPFNQSERARKLSIGAISIVVLSGGFFCNCWHVAEQQWFVGHQVDTESLVVGRMVRSRQAGLFSDGGLLGAGIPNDLHRRGLTLEQAHDQYSAYFDGLTFDEYSPYMSQTGGQGVLFGLLDSSIPLSPQRKLKAFYMLTSLLSAIALTLVILWFYCEFGLCVAIFVACSMVLSQWLTVFGRNLWWSIWAFYLPMIVVMYLLRYRRVSTDRRFVTFGILVFVSVFAKCLINGCEYITTTLIMMVVPFFYYGILDRLGVRRFLKGTLVAVLGSFLAVLLSLMILSLQIASVKGNLSDGVEHIADSLGKRTHGDPRELPEFPYKSASLNASTIGVTVTYLEGTFLDVNNYLTTSNPFVSRFLFRIRYMYLIVLFFVMTTLVVYYRSDNTSTEQRQRDVALVLTTWFSILAPLSWFVIFKAHSYVHTHMNHLLWQMPFTLFGFAVCGLAVKGAFSDVGRKRRHSAFSGRNGREK